MVRKAAEQSYASAEADLGVMNSNAQGVPQDVIVYMAEFGGCIRAAGCAEGA